MTTAKMTAPPATWHPATEVPPASWHLVHVGGEVHEALYFANADSIANLLISAGADHPLINGRWRIANDTVHRMMIRRGVQVTAWAEMPRVEVPV
jgi:hypothetical protein